jgi:hypothetical protein
VLGKLVLILRSGIGSWEKKRFDICLVVFGVLNRTSCCSVFKFSIVLMIYIFVRNNLF